MAGMTKNDPNNRKHEFTVKLALSGECEECSTQCERGKNYLERMKLKGQGNGVPCIIKK